MTDTQGAPIDCKDIPPDIKEFILNYPPVGAAERLGREEMVRLNRCIEGYIAREAWFSTTRFVTKTSDWRVFQLWGREWNAAITPGCPWLHFESHVDWDNAYMEVSLDIERQPGVPVSTIQSLARQLNQRISQQGLTWLKGNGWLIHEALEKNRMLLHTAEPLTRDAFSARWVVSKAVQRIGELAQLIPSIDETLSAAFRAKT